MRHSIDGPVVSPVPHVYNAATPPISEMVWRGSIAKSFGEPHTQVAAKTDAHALTCSSAASIQAPANRNTHRLAGRGQ